MTGIYPNDLGDVSLLEAAAEVQTALTGFDSSRARGPNRIAQLCKTVLVNADRIVAVDDPAFPHIVQAFKDVHELRFIVKVLGSRLQSDPFAQRFDDCLVDRPVPGSETDSAGRDVQFELLVAASATRAGLGVESPPTGTADWMIRTPLKSWCAEVKRVKSERAMERRLKKAHSQILSTGLPGVAFVDIAPMRTSAARMSEARMSIEELWELNHREGVAFRRDVVPRVRNWIGASPLALLVVYDFLLPRPETSGGEWTPVCFWRYHWLHDEGHPWYPRFREFKDLFNAGVPNRSTRAVRTPEPRSTLHGDR